MHSKNKLNKFRKYFDQDYFQRVWFWV